MDWLVTLGRIAFAKFLLLGSKSQAVLPVAKFFGSKLFNLFFDGIFLSDPRLEIKVQIIHIC